MQGKPLTVRDYHLLSSHRLDGYARGPEALDWSGQPDPFRHFEGAAQTALPLLSEKHEGATFGQLFQPGSVTPAPMDIASIAALFELSLGLSAWKAYGPDRWALRCNPSSGNLHPTEGYLVAAGIGGLEDGSYHYRPDEHLLEQRAVIPLSNTSEHEPRLLIGLSSILWREAWKYGERAFRYCQLDIGHAISAFAYAAATLGWQLHLHDHHADREVATLLGLNDAESFSEAEPEVAELLFELTPHPINQTTTQPIPEIWFKQAAESKWTGCANRIDPHPYGTWPVVEEIARATIKAERTEIREADPITDTEPRTLDDHDDQDIRAAALIKQRRSAQQFDPRVMMPLESFLQILDGTLLRNSLPPWPANAAPAATHLLIFVHRVAGLRQGLYALPRSPEGLALMQQEMSKQFLWEKVEIANELPLYLLIHADSRNAAKTLSCHQPIASDSAFAVSMLGEFDRSVGETPANYRHLFIEAGQIGQALYLEAELTGFRGTGIGCYFDPAMHQTLGFESTALQATYHFTVGTPLIDDRIETQPPYAHLERMKT